MRIKAVINPNDSRQGMYIRFLEKSFPELLTEENPEMYYVLGGDGAMLHAHKNFPDDIPFFGKNLGTAGFIMNSFGNDFTVISGLLDDSIKPVIIRTPKIKVKVTKNGEVFEYCAINDVIIGSDISDYNSFEISTKNGLFDKDIVNGLGLAISTPLGSTAFNVNNDGMVLEIDSNMWSITSVVTDRNIDEILKPQDMTIKIHSKRCDPAVYIDGVATKIVLTNGDKIKISKTKDKFSIAFLDIRDYNNKRIKLLQGRR